MDNTGWKIAAAFGALGALVAGGVAVASRRSLKTDQERIARRIGSLEAQVAALQNFATATSNFLERLGAERASLGGPR